MRIGIISNSDTFIPLAYTLAKNNLQVYIFYSPSESFVTQKVNLFAETMKLPLTTEQDKDADLYNWANDTAPDMIFMQGYKYLIDLRRIKKVKNIFNIHFGLLPVYRGPVPVFWQLRSGNAKIGFTIHRLSAGWDDGPALWMKQVNNEPWYNYNYVNQLFGQLCVEGAVRIIQVILSGKEPEVIPLDASKKQYHKRPGLNDVLIDWQNADAKAVCDLVRACNPWNKGALTSFNNNELKITDAVVMPPKAEYADAMPGTIVAADTQLVVSCRDGNAVGINTVFLNDSFIPAYDAKHYGLTPGKVIGQTTR